MRDEIEYDGRVSRSREHLDVDLCLSLVYGLLPARRVESILEHVSSCSACEQLLRDCVIGRERLRSRHGVRLNPAGVVLVTPGLEEDVAAAGPRREGHDPGQSRRWWQRWVAADRGRQLGWAGLAAAAAVILIMLILPGTNQQGADIRLPRMSPMSVGTSGQVRFGLPGGDLSQEDLYTGLAAYESGQYERAAALLSQAHVAERWEIPRRIYLANALAQTGQYRSAISLLRGVDLRIVPEPWGIEAQQTLLAALQAVGENSIADSLRRELARTARATDRRR